MKFTEWIFFILTNCYDIFLHMKMRVWIHFLSNKIIQQVWEFWLFFNRSYYSSLLLLSNVTCKVISNLLSTLLNNSNGVKKKEWEKWECFIPSVVLLPKKQTFPKKEILHFFFFLLFMTFLWILDNNLWITISH